MKKLLIRSTLIIFSIAAMYGLWRWANNWYEDYQHQQWLATAPHTASPNVHIYPDTLEIDYLGTKRTISVYLPEDYKDNDSTRYPVIYFMDGEAAFDQIVNEGTEWQVDEVIDSLTALGGPGAIVIGVHQHPTKRLTEYKPFLSEHVRSEKEVTGPQHAEWIATDVKRWVDTNYRTLSDPDHTTIGGCSLGGLMAWYMISHHPDVYGNALVWSPSLWTGDQVYTWQHNLEDWSDKKIYLCAGTIEAPVLEWAQKLHGLLKEVGMTEDNLRIDAIQDEGHWHMCWRKAFKKAYPWIIE